MTDPQKQLEKLIDKILGILADFLAENAESLRYEQITEADKYRQRLTQMKFMTLMDPTDVTMRDVTEEWIAYCEVLGIEDPGVVAVTPEAELPAPPKPTPLQLALGEVDRQVSAANQHWSITITFRKPYYGKNAIQSAEYWEARSDAQDRADALNQIISDIGYAIVVRLRPKLRVNQVIDAYTEADREASQT